MWNTEDEEQPLTDQQQNSYEWYQDVEGPDEGMENTTSFLLAVNQYKASQNVGKAVPEPLQGNIYRTFALGLSKHMDWRKRLGLGGVILIQAIAPLAIFFWALAQIDLLDLQHLKVRKATFLWQSGSSVYMEDGGISKTLLATKLLCLLFFIGMCQATSFILGDEYNNWRKVKLLIDYAPDQVQAAANRVWLLIGAAMSIYVALFVVMDIGLIFLVQDSPNDVVFDSLGLMFLIKIADVAGDINVLSDVFDENVLGMIHANMVWVQFCRYHQDELDAFVAHTEKKGGGWGEELVQISPELKELVGPKYQDGWVSRHAPDGVESMIDNLEEFGVLQIDQSREWSNKIAQGLLFFMPFCYIVLILIDVRLKDPSVNQSDIKDAVFKKDMAIMVAAEVAKLVKASALADATWDEVEASLR